MQTLSKETYEEIRSWVYRYGRHLDIARWQFFLENGTKEAVAEALAFYQNEDGGFGHGLEPDNSNPNSSPATTAMAYGILESISCTQKEHPLIEGILRYIQNTEYFTEHGCYWSIPSNNQYPCCPWYFFPNAPWFPEDWPAENYTNADIFRIVLKYLDKDDAVYQKTLRAIEYRLPLAEKFTEFCTFAKSNDEQSIEANDWLTLFKLLSEYGLKSQEECERRKAEFLTIAKSAAREDVSLPIQKRAEGKGVSQQDLDTMVDRLTHHSIWNRDALRSSSPEEKQDQVAMISPLWWPIINVIEDLKTLKDNGRLQE